MNRIFNPENRFWNFMNKITDVFFLGILWFVCSLPVVTAGAATTALFQFTLKQADDEEGYVWRSFWRAFRNNFRKATILWGILLAVGIFLVLDLYACINIQVTGGWQIICFALVGFFTVVYVMTAIYVFPLLSRFEKPVWTLLAHSFVMAMGNMCVSVTILAVDTAFLAAAYYVPLLFPVLAGYAAFSSSYLYRYVFKRYSVADKSCCSGEK